MQCQSVVQQEPWKANTITKLIVRFRIKYSTIPEDVISLICFSQPDLT